MIDFEHGERAEGERAQKELSGRQYQADKISIDKNKGKKTEKNIFLYFYLLIFFPNPKPGGKHAKAMLLQCKSIVIRR